MGKRLCKVQEGDNIDIVKSTSPTRKKLHDIHPMLFEQNAAIFVNG